jgi:hypothetical protein
MTAPARRLSDKILAAFTQACEQGELDVAELLLQGLDLTLTREARDQRPDQRREFGQVTEAYSRLKALRDAAATGDQAFAMKSK